MQNVLNFLKEAWHNERGRAIITLCLWILFFIICFGLLNYGNSSSNSTLEQRFDNYEYYMELTINNKRYNIEGIRYQEKELIEIEELNKEYINDFSNIKELYNLDLKYLRLETIKNNVENATSKREVTYTDGSFKVFYEIKASEFLISDSDNYINDELINLDVKYKNNIISNVNVDLTNKMKKINKNITNYKIDIIYTNIGNIKDFELD